MKTNHWLVCGLLTLVWADNAPAQPTLADTYGKLPLSFEVNAGQTDPQVRYVSRGNGYTLFLAPTEALLALRAESPRQKEASTFPAKTLDPTRPITREQSILRMRLIGANSRAHIEGLQQLPGTVNYFVGNNPEQWRTHIPTYARVACKDVYPGIDLIYYGNQRQLEYDFKIAPGADPKRLRLAIEGAEKLELDPQGDLFLHTASGVIRQHKPVMYQESNGVRQAVDGHFVLKSGNQLAFAVGRYDRRKPLTIDPVLAYSTFLGGTSEDQGFSIAVDPEGNVYVTGTTLSKDFPVTSGALQTTNSGGSTAFDYDAFVVKLGPEGTNLVYATYLGGSGGHTLGDTIALDSAGNAYVAGRTSSANFPVTPGAYQAAVSDKFVAKLNADGSALVYSTFLGNGGYIRGIAADSLGNTYVTGDSDLNFPTTPGAFDTSNSVAVKCFVGKLGPEGTNLVYGTYLGGSNGDFAKGITVDASGNAYVCGSGSWDFPTTSGAYKTNNGFGGAFVTKLGAEGTNLVYSTFLDATEANAITVDVSGQAYVGGTVSHDVWDVYVAKLGAEGTNLVYSTSFGGSSIDEVWGIAVDTNGNAYVAGSTQSPDFPTTRGALAACFRGNGDGGDAFVTKIGPAGTNLVYSTYLGGSGYDVERGIGVDAAGNVYVTGWTGSTDFPTTPGAYDTSIDGNSWDAFVTKLSDWDAPQEGDVLVTQTAQPNTAIQGWDLTYTLSASIAGLGAASDVTLTDVLPDTVTFVSASVGCTNIGGIVTCDLGELGHCYSPSVTIAVRPTTIGMITNTVTVSANELDPDPGNNYSTLITAVKSPGPSDLTASWTNLTASCDSKAVKCKVKGTLLIQNIGDGDAPSSIIRFYLNVGSGDEFLKQISTGTIKPGKPKKKTLSAKISAAGHIHRAGCVIAVLDADHTLIEYDEQNNTATSCTGIQPKSLLKELK